MLDVRLLYNCFKIVWTSGGINTFVYTSKYDRGYTDVSSQADSRPNGLRVSHLVIAGFGDIY